MRGSSAIHECEDESPLGGRDDNITVVVKVRYNLPEDIKSNTYRIRDLDIHVLEAGLPCNPLILLLHGFPELAYSWRSIILPLSAAGYRVVAPDQRGSGQTTSTTAGDAPISYEDDISPSGMLNMAHDAVALVYGLGHTEAAAVIGHDFGSIVAAHCALIRPDLFRTAVCMSAPFTGVPLLPFDVAKLAVQSQTSGTGPWANLNTYLASLTPPMKHYTAYFSGPTANADMLNAPQGLHGFLRTYFHVKSGDWAVNDPHPLAGPHELIHMPHYYIMPHDATMPEALRDYAPSQKEVAENQWLPDEDLDVYVQEFGRTGFQGALNRYRAALDDRLAEGLRLFSGKKIEVPFMFLSGRKDWGVYQRPGGIELLRSLCTQWKEENFVLVDGAGHWVQQERPDEVVSNIERFLMKSQV
ncbi:hypothetical protein EIP86_001450 [Pleurotus ostreatoroseus]|nr:hypothetical protein EIP86_001450 [Pleurotus ostreatoroseus]